jgi:D-aminopeptidase
LVQSNFGGVLQMDGIQVGKELGQYDLKDELDNTSADGSIMIVIATDAPLSDRNLKRLARRGLAGLARTGASMSNGSGDYVIAFSTAEEVLRMTERRSKIWAYPEVPNDAMSPLFQAAIEATEEAIYDSLCMATTMTGYREREVRALPLDAVGNLLQEHKNR